MTQQADQYDDVLARLGLDGLSEEEKTKVVSQIQEMVDNQVMLTIFSHLTDEQIDQMEKELAAYPDDDEDRRTIRLLSQIGKYYPDYEQAILDDLEALYTRLKDDVVDVKSYLEANWAKISGEAGK